MTQADVRILCQVCCCMYVHENVLPTEQVVCYNIVNPALQLIVWYQEGRNARTSPMPGSPLHVWLTPVVRETE